MENPHYNRIKAVLAEKGKTGTWLSEQVLQSQARAAQMINGEQLSLYYGIGRYISEHSREGYWGTGAIARISKQLKSELPGLKGFSEENIKLMRRFYEAWKDIEAKSVVGTTEMPQITVSQTDTNSVDASTELQEPNFDFNSVRQLQLTRDVVSGGLSPRDTEFPPIDEPQEGSADDLPFNY